MAISMARTMQQNPLRTFNASDAHIAQLSTVVKSFVNMSHTNVNMLSYIEKLIKLFNKISFLWIRANKFFGWLNKTLFATKNSVKQNTSLYASAKSTSKAGHPSALCCTFCTRNAIITFPYFEGKRKNKKEREKARVRKRRREKEIEKEKTETRVTESKSESESEKAESGSGEFTQRKFYRK